MNRFLQTSQQIFHTQIKVVLQYLPKQDMSIYKQFDITDKIPLLLQQLAKTRVLHVTIFHFCQSPNFQVLHIFSPNKENIVSILLYEYAITNMNMQ